MPNSSTGGAASSANSTDLFSTSSSGKGGSKNWKNSASSEATSTDSAALGSSDKGGWKSRVNSHLVAGILGGLVPTVSLYPLELVKTRMQVVDGMDKAYSSNYSSLRSSFRAVLSNEGVKGLYKGITPAVLAAAGSWGGYFYFYEHSKNRKLLQKAPTLNDAGEKVEGKLGTGTYGHRWH